MIGLIPVEEREDGTGVDDHRSPNPARCWSAWRAIGAPLANNPPRGAGRGCPTVERRDSRITSASEIPRSLATRLTAALSSGGRYNVVFSIDVYGTTYGTLCRREGLGRGQPQPQHNRVHSADEGRVPRS